MKNMNFNYKSYEFSMHIQFFFFLSIHKSSLIFSYALHLTRHFLVRKVKVIALMKSFYIYIFFLNLFTRCCILCKCDQYNKGGGMEPYQSNCNAKFLQFIIFL